MKRIATLLLPGVLAGCVGLPQQISMLSQAANGVSLVFTGKTNTDHVLSAALEKDCSLFRVVDGKPVCRNKKVNDLDKIALRGSAAVLNVEPAAGPSGRDDAVTVSDDTEIAAAPQPQKNGAEGAAFSSQMFFTPATQDGAARIDNRAVASLPSAAKKGHEAPMKTAAKAPVKAPVAMVKEDALHAMPPREATVKYTVHEATPRREYYVALASYHTRGHAQRTATRAGNALETRLGVGMAEVNGRTVYRVIAGPMTRKVADETRVNVKAAGFGTAWLVRACIAKRTRSNCIKSSDITTALAR